MLFLIKRGIRFKNLRDIDANSFETTKHGKKIVDATAWMVRAKALRMGNCHRRCAIFVCLIYIHTLHIYLDSK